MRASYLRMLTHEGGGTIPGCLMSLCVRPSELVNVISSDKVSPGQKRETNSCRLFADKIQDKTIYMFYLPLPFGGCKDERINPGPGFDLN